MGMTKDQVRKAFEVCDQAFKLYIKEATETHRLLSTLSGDIALVDRVFVIEQRVRENDAQLAYVSARGLLFDVLLKTTPLTIRRVKFKASQRAAIGWNVGLSEKCLNSPLRVPVLAYYRLAGIARVPVYVWHRPLAPPLNALCPPSAGRRINRRAVPLRFGRRAGGGKTWLVGAGQENGRICTPKELLRSDLSARPFTFLHGRSLRDSVWF
jgi:hypothetical protein